MSKKVLGVEQKRMQEEFEKEVKDVDWVAISMFMALHDWYWTRRYPRGKAYSPTSDEIREVAWELFRSLDGPGSCSTGGLTVSWNDEGVHIDFDAGAVFHYSWRRENS